MSGGSYDYAFLRVNDFVCSLRYKAEDPRRAALAKLLLLVSDAMHAVEWEDSGDTGKEATDKAIDAVFSFLKANPETIKKAAAYDALKEYFQK